MSDENQNGAGAEGAAQPQTPAQPAAPGPQFITREDFLAAQKLQAEQFAKILQDSIGTLKGEVLEAVVPGRAKAPVKPAPRQAAPVLPEVPKPLDEDPAFQAHKTKIAEMEARLAAAQQQLDAETKARAAAQDSAKQAEKERAIMRELTDLDNPNRTSEEYAILATELLTRRGVVRYAKDGKLYMTLPGDDGTDKTVPLKDGVRSWLNTEEGRRLRPAPPSGGGTQSGGWGGAPAAEGAQLTTAQQFAVALQKQQQMQGGRGPNN